MQCGFSAASRSVAAVVLAAGLCGVSSASPVFTTVVLDDFEASSEDRRWAAQVGSSGHVVYFADTELRRWFGGQTTVLHEVGTHLEGLAPDVTTAIREEGYARRGMLLGVDRDGGVSVYLFTEADAGQHAPAGLLASTTPGGGFRAVMARDDVAASTGVIRSGVSTPYLGLLRSDDGYSIASGRVDGVPVRRVFTPDLQSRELFTDGDRTPLDDGVIQLGNSPFGYPLGLDRRFGSAMHQDVAPGGMNTSYIHYIRDGSQALNFGVVRDLGSGIEPVVPLPAPGPFISIQDSLNRPKIRINASGDTLVYSRLYIMDPNWPSIELRFTIIPADGGGPDVIVESSRYYQPQNFPEIRINLSRGHRTLNYQIHFGDDGSVLFEAEYREPNSSEKTGMFHRDPSGVLTMLLAPDAAFLGSPGATVSTVWPSETVLIGSLDASSAAGLYNVNSTPTIFYATPGELTKVAAVGETLEVAPGDVRQISGLELLDVNGPRVLFRADFADNSKGMFVMNAAPACPADLNNNGVVDADDFFLFLQWFADGDPRADINGDGVIDADDFFEYLTLFAQGC
ncbi:MAG: dockerin type I repeat-containing protein [Phycisphaerales bacterium]|nr:dockerin type I repeat-containing protein [Phycisphaerales bacterium]